MRRVLLRHLAAAGIGCHDHKVVPGPAAHVVGKDRQRRQMVEWDVEEALDLAGVQIHSEHAVAAGNAEEISHQACRDGLARQ